MGFIINWRKELRETKQALAASAAKATALRHDLREAKGTIKHLQMLQSEETRLRDELFRRTPEWIIYKRTHDLFIAAHTRLLDKLTGNMDAQIRTLEDQLRLAQETARTRNKVIQDLSPIKVQLKGEETEAVAPIN